METKSVEIEDKIVDELEKRGINDGYGMAEDEELGARKNGMLYKMVTFIEMRSCFG